MLNSEAFCLFLPYMEREILSGTRVYEKLRLHFPSHLDCTVNGAREVGCERCLERMEQEILIETRRCVKWALLMRAVPVS